MREAPTIKRGIRHHNLILRVSRYLAEKGPNNTTAILEHINNTTRHGSTMNELGNVLAKCGYFRKAGSTQGRSLGSGHYDIVIWDIEVKEE